MTTINGTPIHALSMEEVSALNKELVTINKKRKSRALNKIAPDYEAQKAAAKNDYNRLQAIAEEDRASSYLYDYVAKAHRKRLQFLALQEFFGKKLQEAQEKGFQLITLLPTKAKSENLYYLAPSHLNGESAQRMAADHWLRTQELNADKYRTYNGIIRRENEGAVKASIQVETVPLARASRLLKLGMIQHSIFYSGDKSRELLTGLLQS